MKKFTLCVHNVVILYFLFAEFDLEKEKSALDEQGLRIAENQENSQKNRRKLAESTRGNVFLYGHVTFWILLFFMCLSGNIFANVIF